ncbi:hypothetical protein COCCADRAFT_10436 [Bipolaris zeicola 26-R-13]|uniref:Uncharacterized protein n=1 Tax=Cochliobolus carbonum (strain 26-R-13) TaxID=930089 RepID=W6XVH7_COCC2|nr:uncharacterized protein COCCADRAFT_10436 [Bipolaris zeicola 26-R-13]EUC26779.1 hypothetical protein COCCADRAFT_10436 [Bipolaris zeicola 26-R-13]
MKFAIAIVAVFAALTSATAVFPNRAPRGTHCSNYCGGETTTCCEVDGCCYPCYEGSDADCTPEVTE